MKISKRQLKHAARARAIVKDLLDSLGATTSYAKREPRRRDKFPWRTLYGWELAFTAKKGSVLDADGRPTQVDLIRKFTHEPGDIVKSASGASYMVRTDHSLKKI